MPTLVEKPVLVNHKVDDLWGLFMDLRRADFKVRNVAADLRGTYVYLELDEEKDPAPVVEAWVGKPAPKASMILKDVRVKELKKVTDEEAIREQARMEEERRRDYARAQAAEAMGGMPIEVTAKETEVASDKIGLLKRLFRKFF